MKPRTKGKDRLGGRQERDASFRQGSATPHLVSRDALLKNTLPEAQIKITANSKVMEGS